MKKLPCARPCCMSLDPAKMKECPNRAVTGFFDEESHGQGLVQYREKAKKKKNFKIELKMIDREKHEKTLTIKDFEALVSKASKPKTPAKNIHPKKRKPSDYENPAKSAQTRKGRLPHETDYSRYKKIKADFRMSPAFLRSQGSFLVPSSPLRPSTNEPDIPPAQCRFSY